MDKIEISIILPVYNGENFIQKAYYFILGQKIENIEIIFVDNNSKDNSIEEIQKLQAIDQRILLLRQSIQGAAAARNKGIENAKGKYLYMFDVDDQIFPGALSSMKRVLDENEEIDAVFGKMIKSHNDINETEIPYKDTDEVINKNKPYWGLKWFSDLSSVVGPPAFLYRKSVFEKIGFYETNVPASEDTALDIKLGMLCNVAFIDRYVYLYFKHEMATTHLIKQKTDRAFMQWPRFTRSHLPFYLNHKVPVEFKKILFKGIYRSLARMLNLTKGIKNRKALKDQLLKEISPIETPWIINSYLNFMVLINTTLVYKIYIYYFIPKFLPKIINMNHKHIKAA